jgi:hypothetical protein
MYSYKWSKKASLELFKTAISPHNGLREGLLEEAGSGFQGLILFQVQ